jgi:hypothetical protein
MEESHLVSIFVSRIIDQVIPREHSLNLKTGPAGSTTVEPNNFFSLTGEYVETRVQFFRKLVVASEEYLKWRAEWKMRLPESRVPSCNLKAWQQGTCDSMGKKQSFI